MNEQSLTADYITNFKTFLHSEERSKGTIEKYIRDVRAFAVWLDGRQVTKETAYGWKEHLQEENYAPVTINSMLAALNSFFRFAGLDDCKIKFLKVQRRMFREQSREMTRAEYERLQKSAQSLGHDRLALLMEAICATGIRVSEVRYLTVEAAQKGEAEISLKGKIRNILLPNKLCRKLLKYAKSKKITSGEIFITGSGNSLSRKQIWAEMKLLCQHAGVERSKVFPHNLRHLFAATFYKACKDVVRLADVLGHSSIETTRIYLTVSVTEYRKQLDMLGLVS